MAGATISGVVDILKDDYGDYTRAFNDDCWILDNAVKGRDDFVGLRVKHVLHTKRSAGIGSRGDDGTLPAAGNQTVKSMLIPMRRHYGRIAITGPLMKQANTNPGAFVDGLKLEMEGIRKDYGRDLCRQAWGTSNGVIATCASDNGANPAVVTLDSAATETQAAQCYGEGGMLVDIGTVANPVLRVDGAACTDFDISTPGAYTITVSADGGTFAVAGTDFVFRHGNGGASDNSGDEGDGQLELTGLQTAISASATLHTLTVANGSKKWQAQSFANGGTNRPPTETLLMSACMKTSQASGENVDAGVCSGGVLMSLINMQIAQKRHTVPITPENANGIKLQAGASGIVVHVPGWGGKSAGMLPIVADRDAPANALWGLHFQSIKRYEHTAPEWMDDDGSVLHWDGSKDRFEAVLRSYLELGYTRRDTMFKIADLEEASS